MMLRIQKERLAGMHLDLEEYVSRYQLNQERLQRMAPEAIVMHPGPMIRGLEITSEVADGAAVGDRRAGATWSAHPHGSDSPGFDWGPGAWKIGQGLG